jgi:hypothetical protein
MERTEALEKMMHHVLYGEQILARENGVSLVRGLKVNPRNGRMVTLFHKRGC